MLELDANIGRIMDAIRAEAPDTIVIVTADNGAWQDAYPDAGTTPFRGEKGSGFEGGWRVPGLMWWPGQIPAGAQYDEMMSHIDCWATLATMVGLTPPPQASGWTTTASRSTSTASTTAPTSSARREHSARKSWIYIDGETFNGRPRRHRRRSQGTLAQYRVEVPLHRQGLLARRHGQPRRHRRDLQPHHGPLREIRHDVQWRRSGTRADDIAGQVRGLGQWLGACR